MVVAPGVCAACGSALDAERYAVCEVCGGKRLCLECARAHYCTPECPARGCRAGLCVKVVVRGEVAADYGA